MSCQNYVNIPLGEGKTFWELEIENTIFSQGRRIHNTGSSYVHPLKLLRAGQKTHDCPYHSRYCKPQCRGTQNRPCKIRDTLGTELVCFLYIGYRCAHPLMKNIYIYIRIWKIKTSSTSIPAYATYMKTLLRVTTREWIYPLVQGKYGR